MLIQEENGQIKERESSTIECESQAFLMKGKQYHQKVQDNRSNGRNWKYDDKNSSSKNPNRSKWKCHYCGKQGHKANECYKRINDGKYKSTKSFDSKRNVFV